MAKPKMVRRQVLMTDELWNKLTEIAASEGTNTSAIVRKACLRLTVEFDQIPMPLAAGNE